jgi:sirohydrochlorin ferrochelatase
VGTASLRGIPGLLRLREAGFRVWPFDEPRVGVAPLVVEIYTRLMTGAVVKSSEAARTAYLAKKRRESGLYAGVSRGVMAKARGSEDGFDALVTTLAMVEHRGEFAGLRRTEDEVFRLEGRTWVPGLEG